MPHTYRSPITLACIPLALALLLAAPSAVSANEAQWDHFNDLMKEGLDHGTLWSRGWTAFFGASATLSLYLATNADEQEDRYDARVRTVTSSLGLIDTLTNPPPHAQAYRDYHSLRRRHSDSDTGLQQAHSLLEELRREEQQRTGWRGRIGALLVNTGAYFAIAEGDGRRDDGLQVAGIGLLINEIKVRTEPTTISDAPNLRLGNASVTLHPQVYATNHGIGVRIAF